MAAVDVILAAEQGGGLVQQGGRNGGQVFRQAVNLLVQVRLHQVKNAASGELIRLRSHTVLHKPVGIQIDAPAGVFRQRRLKRQNAAEAVGALLQMTARSKKGRIKRQMFAKLRTTKYLKTAATEDSASVQFDGKVQRIARVHHYGLRDRVRRNGPEARYPARRLLGVNDEVETVTLNTLMRWIME